MERKITNLVRGFRTKDGAGVSLVRVLGGETMNAYSPILMMDSFDSVNPDEYTKGFPYHPHRGIETITYLSNGQITHRDSLGNEDTIMDGEVQWMTAGSGILHEEVLPVSKRLLGVQLWLNLPKKDKMVPPAYKAIKKDEIQVIQGEGAKLRLLCGNYKDFHGYQSKYLPLDFYEITLESEASIVIDVDADRSVMAFTLLHDALIANQKVDEKVAVKLEDGNQIRLQAGKDGAIILLVSSQHLDEPVAWGGPIVMNSEEELNQAFYELRNGTFLKDHIDY